MALATIDVVKSEVGVSPDVLDYAHDVSTALASLRPDLVGVYLHGSAVLGGFRPGGSDVDVLAVVARPGAFADQRVMGEVIAAVAGCPGRGLEMGVITSETAAVGDCGFEVHVNTTGPEVVIVTGVGHAGDHDLVLHCAVCRRHGLPVTGPPAAGVFGEISADRVLAAMIREREAARLAARICELLCSASEPWLTYR